MIETGTVKDIYLSTGKVLVEFRHLGTEGECDVLQPTTGEKTIYILPTKGTQVVCWLESGKNIVLGALFSDSQEPIPDTQADLYIKCGEAECTISDNKLQFKNSSADFKTLLKDILNTIKNITVSTPMGASGTPLPPTITSVMQLEKTVDNLLK